MMVFVRRCCLATSERDYACAIAGCRPSTAAQGIERVVVEEHLQLRLSGTQPDAVLKAANDRHRDTRAIRREVAGMEVYDVR